MGFTYLIMILVWSIMNGVLDLKMSFFEIMMLSLATVTVMLLDMIKDRLDGKVQGK